MFKDWWGGEATFGTWLVALALVVGAIITGAIGSEESNSLEARVSGFKSFEEEVRRVDSATSCTDPGTVPAMAGDGRLYGCIMGLARTAKFFINERGDRDNAVENIKVMWNDWWKDIGYGQHADQAEAVMMVGALAQLYAPELMPELLSTFRSRTNQVLHSNAFTIEYRFTRGPAIDERLLTVSER